MAVRLRKLPPTIFQRFFRTETASGSVLLLFGIAALALANSPLAASYAGIWRIPLNVGIADYSLSLTLHEWINDGLMAVFFLLVGLEIKRELLAGELSSARQSHASNRLRYWRNGCARCDLFDFQFRRIRVARLGYSHGNRHRLCPRRTRSSRSAGAQSAPRCF